MTMEWVEVEPGNHELRKDGNLVGRVSKLYGPQSPWSGYVVLPKGVISGVKDSYKLRDVMARAEKLFTGEAP